MGTAAAVVLYVAGVFALAGLMAPVLAHLSRSFNDYPFARVVNRSLMISALVLLIPLARATGLVGITRSVFARKAAWGREWGIGFVTGIASLAVVLGLHLIFGTRTWTGEWSWKVFVVILLVAFLVSLLEEWLFRGVVQTLLVRDLGRWGLFLGALIYAVVHFIKVPRTFVPDPVVWYSGFQALALAFEPFTEPAMILDRLLILIFVGLILGILFQRSGVLWAAIGLHAGWIVALKLFGDLSTGAGDLMAGGLTTGVLALLTCAVWRWYPPFGPGSANGAGSRST